MKNNNFYRYILSIVNNEHFYYVFFFGILGIIFLIEFLNISFDENILIGYKNILNFYYNIEQIIIFNFWFNSIKAAYNKLV